MKIILAIGAGSMLGGVLRYLMVLWCGQKHTSDFPVGTLLVNLLGCLLIGVMFHLSEHWNLSPEWRMAITTGLLGGFTTFSAFSMETMVMLRGGFTGAALLYLLMSVGGGLLATLAGFALTKWITAA